jgi:intracellular sulfur oxidation DsrE/DsrF family protein
MKKLMIICFLGSMILARGQEVQIRKGPIVEDFGAVFPIDNPDLVLDKDKTYKVIFDVYSDPAKKKDINPMILTAARYLNMHAQQGVPHKNLKVALVLHGAATKSALNDKAFQKHYGIDNPNGDLLVALKKAKVELYVCGQSYASMRYEKDEKHGAVQMALSALTTLVEYQSDGFQLINFN